MLADLGPESLLVLGQVQASHHSLQEGEVESRLQETRGAGVLSPLVETHLSHIFLFVECFGFVYVVL